VKQGSQKIEGKEPPNYPSARRRELRGGSCFFRVEVERAGDETAIGAPAARASDGLWLGEKRKHLQRVAVIGNRVLVTDADGSIHAFAIDAAGAATYASTIPVEVQP